jgi:FMN-dependent NADH-azoreductase
MKLLHVDSIIQGAHSISRQFSAEIVAKLRLADLEIAYRDLAAASGKRVIIASSRGGIYSEGAPAASAEHQETYLRSVFAFIGIPDIEIVRAEGVAIGPEPKAAAMPPRSGKLRI